MSKPQKSRLLIHGHGKRSYDYDGHWLAVLAAWTIKHASILVAIWLAGEAAGSRLLALLP
jgi:hypothetical protein